jgi:hypothetical protein
MTECPIAIKAVYPIIIEAVKEKTNCAIDIETRE